MAKRSRVGSGSNGRQHATIAMARAGSDRGDLAKAGVALPRAVNPERQSRRAQRGDLAADSRADRLEARTSEMIASIGAKLRSLRLAKGLTLHELSARSGLSSSMLSLLERGKTGPSIGTLVVICSVLGAEMSDLLAPAEPVARDPVSRFASRPVFETADGVTRRILKSDPVHGIEIAINEYSAGTASSPRPVTHEGYEFGVALEGVLEITIGGAAYRLSEGDLVSYHSTEPHRIANPGTERARALWVNLRKA